jgi:hypothetical protein
MIGHFTTNSLLELLAAFFAAAAGIWLYRKRGADDPRHGSQGAVLLFALAAILAIHGLGLLEYRPGGTHL